MDVLLEREREAFGLFLFCVLEKMEALWSREEVEPDRRGRWWKRGLPE